VTLGLVEAICWHPHFSACYSALASREMRVIWEAAPDTTGYS